MRLKRLRIVSAMCGLLLSVAAYAVPIDVKSIEYAAPAVSIEYGHDDTAVTASDFVATTPYVVTLDVATPVPITDETLASLDARNFSGNLAVMQNVNFERTSS